MGLVLGLFVFFLRPGSWMCPFIQTFSKYLSVWHWLFANSKDPHEVYIPLDEAGCEQLSVMSGMIHAAGEKQGQEEAGFWREGFLFCLGKPGKTLDKMTLV